MDELGFGRRLRTYEFTDAELMDAVDSLLDDTTLTSRLAGVGESIRARRGKERAADLIEQVGLSHRAGG
jgi:UDP:flavonoid glycosyltransferase YjiC (YdhE family)